MLNGHELIQVGVNGEEQLVPDFRKNLSFKDLGNLISEADTAICVDSYLQHHFWANRKRAIVLFGVSDPLIFGHPENVNLLKDRKFLRENQFDLYYSNQLCPEAFVSPQEVMDIVNKWQ